MKIDGRKIAEEIRNDLKSKIQDLKSKNIVPKIAIITLGPEASWETYVRQKIKVAGELGIKAVLINLEEADEKKLLQTVREIDKDPNYHGIIVQRPISSHFDKERVVNSISPEKDVDGFRPDSKFEVPVFLAVKRLIAEALLELNIRKGWKELGIIVLGKGETAGGPVIRGLRTMGLEPNIIDSQTKNSNEILKGADVVISCVGKQNIVRPEQIKKGVILIGVGIRGEDGTVKGDYNEQEIEKVAASYTPTPGGVGPVNLSYLFKNLIEAAKLQNQKTIID
ncbi:MAG: hypothetical protein A2868_01820 [Candidatus Levybacteria bacterium RIFCSPHIGHO2_01_FULL_40_15b]|nr:MAG: hypothetical protein A2868_01820 [Candidatus Levybacteria bacterium RIFCSPHIGHO2_01_FULL_40_15b]